MEIYYYYIESSISARARLFRTYCRVIHFPGNILNGSSTLSPSLQPTPMPFGEYHGQKTKLRFLFLLMVQSSNGQQWLDNLTRRMLYSQHLIRWLKCRSQFLWMVKKRFIIALKVTRASGISKTERSLLLSKAMLSRWAQILKPVGSNHCLPNYHYSFNFHSIFFV